MKIRDIINLLEDIEDSEPKVGDIVEMECGDTLIETTIAAVTEDGVVLHLDEGGVRILVNGAQALLEGKTGPGLWANIHARRASGKRMRKKGDKGAPTEKALKAAQAGSKNESVAEDEHDDYENNKLTRDDAIIKMVERLAKQGIDPTDKVKRAFGVDEHELDEIAEIADPGYSTYQEWLNSFDKVDEAKYQGREVPLGKPMAGDVAKRKVYVKGPKGNVVKVNFGQKGVKIKKNNPARRKSFRARHNCKNPGPRWRAKYWSCRMW